MPFSIEEEEKRKEKENINLEKIDIENINLGLKDYTGIVTGIKCKNFVKKMINENIQVHSVSIDLTIGNIFRLSLPRRKVRMLSIDFENSLNTVLTEERYVSLNKLNFWTLKRSSLYKIRTNEIIDCPANFIGLVIPKKFAIQSACLVLNTIIIEPTYYGHVECLVKPFFNINIYKNARLIQLIMLKGEIPDKKFWYLLTGVKGESKKKGDE